MNSGMSHSFGRVKITHVEFCVLIVVGFKGGKLLSVFLIASFYCCIFFCTCVIVTILIHAFCGSPIFFYSS
jgi:hypothetical protein